jgi:DNA repair protein RadC
MHIPKNNLALAELKFSYSNFPQVLTINNTTEAANVLLALWNQQCQCKEPRRYVLFLDGKNQLIAWENLTMNFEQGYCAREIAGLALACNARSVIFSYHRLDNSTPNATDRELVVSTFKICETILVDILDYLLISPNEHLSYKAWLLTN